MIQTNPHSPIPGNNISVNFDDNTNRIHGFDDCNKYFGEYYDSDNMISIGELGSTRRACREENSDSFIIDSVKKKFTELLIDLEQYRIEEDNYDYKLYLKSNNVP